MVVRHIKIFVFFTIVVVATFPTAVLASPSDGTVSGYAWSGQVGWVNFGTTNGNIHITDSAMTGYAWNENAGWLNLNPTNSGVQNNGSGTLSGYAWLEGAGWINFSGVIVSSAGVFSGTATGDNSVSISFGCSNCNVATDWRPASLRGSGGGGGAIAPSVSFTINNGQQYTNNPSVQIFFNNDFSSSDKLIVSNSPDLSGATEEYFQKSRPWSLLSGDGTKTVYARVYPQYGAPSEIVSNNIVLDTIPPEIKITEIKEKYKPNEQVALKGLTENKAEVTLSKDDKAGLFSADEEGKWDVSLGKLAKGKYYVELTPKDLAGNIGKPAKVEILVENGEVPAEKEEEKQPTFFEKIADSVKEIIKPLIPEFLKPAEEEKPEEIAMIPKAVPIAFKGSFRYLSEPALEWLVLAPLPKDFRELALKFPKLEKTFAKVGVRKFTDIGKLENARLELPGLTESILPPSESGKFAAIRGIPIINLSESAMGKIPSGIIFAKAGGGLVDINAILSLSKEGNAVQTIETIVRQKLQLVVRVEKPADKVVGYLVFKSKNRGQATGFNSDASSPFFSRIADALLLNTKSVLAAEKENQPEQRLVLDKFEYEDKGYGVYAASINSPAVDGLYEIVTEVKYKDLSSEEIKLIAVVDPEGYVYKESKELETRVAGATVSLYWLNPKTNQYELWPAKEYQQENPQVTDERGTYSFLTPEGRYYLQVDAPGYAIHKGNLFEVREGSGVHINIKMTPKGWWRLIIDWKVILLLLILALLFYNFYRDKMRE